MLVIGNRTCEEFGATWQTSWNCYYCPSPRIKLLQVRDGSCLRSKDSATEVGAPTEGKNSAY